jgi:fusion and transport protein UGO1
LAAQRKALRELGHIEDLSTRNAKDLEYERSLKKTAQRGVVKLFNAVRASQIKAEEALSQGKGISRTEREEKVKEMSREGFLNLIKGA